MKNILIRFFPFMLYAICLVLGLRVGIAISFQAERIIAPKLSPIIHGIPLLFLVVFSLLLLFSILLTMYLIKKTDVMHLELFFDKRFMKKSLLLLLAGFTFGFAYWIFLQMFVLIFLFIKKAL